MNPWHVYLAMLAMLWASVALGENFKTIRGKEYKDATVTRVEPDGIVIRYKSGISKIFFVELPKEVADRWLAPIIAAKKAADEAAEAKRIEAENAAERERSEREHEREEKAKSVGADLRQAAKQFEAAEQRAAQSYRSAAKGTLSGQVFVSTKGGENFKLGGVSVELFDRNAIDALIAAEKTYADIMIQEADHDLGIAKAAWDQARAAEEYSFNAYLASRYNGPNRQALEQSYNQTKEVADRAGDEYERIGVSRDHYYSGAFYFLLLVNPIHVAETDADGKFAIEVPKTGTFVIAAKAERSVGEHTERYFWLQPVSLEGEQQLTRNLSNNNLTSMIGSSSLIQTQD